MHARPRTASHSHELATCDFLLLVVGYWYVLLVLVLLVGLAAVLCGQSCRRGRCRRRRHSAQHTRTRAFGMHSHSFFIIHHSPRSIVVKACTASACTGAPESGVPSSLLPPSFAPATSQKLMRAHTDHDARQTEHRARLAVQGSTRGRPGGLHDA